MKQEAEEFFFFFIQQKKANDESMKVYSISRFSLSRVRFFFFASFYFKFNQFIRDKTKCSIILLSFCSIATLILFRGIVMEEVKRNELYSTSYTRRLLHI